MDRITTVPGGQDQTDNASLLPNKLVKLEDYYEGGNEGESMKKRHWR
jgi:hypothetical protein